MSEKLRAAFSRAAMRRLWLLVPRPTATVLRVQRFQQRRPGLELDPAHGNALRCQLLLNQALLTGDDDEADFLIADPQFLRGVLRQGAGSQRKAEGEESEEGGGTASCRGHGEGSFG